MLSTVQYKERMGLQSKRLLKICVFEGFYDLLTEARHFINQMCAEPGCSFSELRDTAGLDVQNEPTKINLPANQKGYNTFETTAGKLSARRIQIFRIYF